MTVEKRNKLLYWLFKALSIILSCVFPIWAICSKFPLWKETYGTGRSVGTGMILIGIVALVVFRKTVFSFLGEKCHLKHAPPVVTWIISLIIAYALLLVTSFLQDLIVVLWMGLIGCALGSVLTFVGEEFFVKKDEKKEEVKNG